MLSLLNSHCIGYCTGWDFPHQASLPITPAGGGGGSLGWLGAFATSTAKNWAAGQHGHLHVRCRNMFLQRMTAKNWAAGQRRTATPFGVIKI